MQEYLKALARFNEVHGNLYLNVVMNCDEDFIYVRRYTSGVFVGGSHVIHKNLRGRASKTENCINLLIEL